MGIDIAAERKQAKDSKDKEVAKNARLEKRKKTAKLFVDSMAEGMKGHMICSQCGHEGRQKQYIKGSLITEIILWLLFLLPGLIYSIWRHASKVKACPKCRGAMIDTSSPVGQQMVKNLAQ